MKHGKSIALISAGLVAGLVLGSLGIAAATTTGSATANGPAGAGLGLGATIRSAGARLVDVLADLTGLSVEDIQAKRADGESIAQIAKSEGVDSQTVVDKALAARKAILDERVAAGSITQEQADAAYTRMTERLNDRVNATTTGPGQGRGRGAGCGSGGVAGSCGGCAAVTTP